MARCATMLPGFKHAPENLGRVLVLGLGKSGKSVVRYCYDLLDSRVEALYIAAGQMSAHSESFVADFANDARVHVVFGDDAVPPLQALVAGESTDAAFDLCIASPGIPFYEQLYVDAQNAAAELISEVEFAWRESRAQSTWIAITGTNGKTTTTACCAHILAEAGLRAGAVGNIGEVCLDAVRQGALDVYVAEVSSYQLYSTYLFAPDVALLLNMTPDHVHWHQTLDAYYAAKFKVLDRMYGNADALAIMDATNDIVRAKIREVKAQSDPARALSYIPVGTKAGLMGDMRQACGARNAAFLTSEGSLCVAYEGAEHIVGAANDLQIKGLHNVSNALMAAACCVACNVDDDVIARALASFSALEHRIEPCGEIAGVVCYNDSKATNIDASIKALEAFHDQRLVVLLGGDDKETDLADLIASAHKHARVVVCYGQGGPRFADAFDGAADLAPADFVVARAARLADALDCALELARPGEVLLLSPACASFDEFSSFEQRGRVFKDLVAQRMSDAPAQGLASV